MYNLLYMNYVYLLVPGCNGYGQNYCGLEKLKFSIDSLKKNTNKYNKIYVYYGYDNTSFERINDIKIYCEENNLIGVNIGNLKHDFGICHASGISNPYRLNILIEKIYILINHDENEEICFIDIDTEFNTEIDNYVFDYKTPILWANEHKLLCGRDLRKFFKTMNYYVDPESIMFNSGVIYIPKENRKKIGEESLNLVLEMNKYEDCLRVARDLDEQIALSIIIYKHYKNVNLFKDILNHYWEKVHREEKYWN